jgi:hypothetical protein
MGLAGMVRIGQESRVFVVQGLCVQVARIVVPADRIVCAVSSERQSGGNKRVTFPTQRVQRIGGMVPT